MRITVTNLTEAPYSFDMDPESGFSIRELIPVRGSIDIGDRIDPYTLQANREVRAAVLAGFISISFSSETDDFFVPPAAGSVGGPASSTDNAITRWDSTTGDTVQDSLVTIDDSGNITLPGGALFDGRDVSADGTDLDNHVADTANPHATDIGNLGAGTLAELNTAVTDATLDDVSGLRTASGLKTATGIVAVSGAAAPTAGQALVATSATAGAWSSPVDTSAIHKATAAEISALTLKSAPVSGDHFLIEDSAAANAKKRTTLGSLGITPAYSQTIFLAKHGSDANAGTHPNKPKLTIGSALAAALALTPSATNRIVVHILDSGRYDDANWTVHSYVDIFAPNAELYHAGAATMLFPEGNNQITFGRVTAESNTSSGFGIFGITGPVNIRVGTAKIQGILVLGVSTNPYPIALDVGLFETGSAGSGYMVYNIATEISLAVRVGSAKFPLATGTLLNNLGAITAGAGFDFDVGTLGLGSGVGFNSTAACTVRANVRSLNLTTAWSMTTGTLRIFYNELIAGATSGASVFTATPV